MRGRTAFRRREVLLGALAAPLVLASCTDPPEPPPPPDPLAALAAAARADEALAAATAVSVPALADAATAVASARGEHAAALQREVDRERPPVSSSAAATSPAAVTPPPPEPAAAKAALVEALTVAEQRAAELVTSVPRYRAGLVGSVAAGCASLREVLT